MINHITSSDHHINSLVGLCAPRVQFDNGGVYEYSERQAVIYKYFLDFCNRIQRLPGEKIIILNGDLFDLDPVSHQRISSNVADVLKIGEKTLEPLLSINGYKFITRGTEYHVGNAGYLEELFAQRINAERCTETGTYSWWHLRQSIEGVNFDIAHHTSIGGLPWTKVNKSISMIYEIQGTCIENDYPIPHIVLRGHVHQHVDTKNINKKTRFIITPSWQAKTAYGYKAATNKITEHGGTIIKINNGTYDLENIIYTPRKEQVWTL